MIETKYAESVQGIKEEWFVDNSNNWYNYIMQLPTELKITYLVVVLHNQVFNGGFHQYFINGYGQFSKATINALLEIKAINKAELLEKALKLVSADIDNDAIFRKKLLNKEINNLFQNDILFEPLDKLDSKYYKNEDENIEQLLGNYLQK